jgi:Ca-activated chloride channel family protein
MKAVLRRLVAGAIPFALLFGACSTPAPEDTSHQISVLAGSELKDLVPLLPDIQKNTGYSLKLNYTGSLDGAQAIVDGDKSDAAWFSSGNYLALLE